MEKNQIFFRFFFHFRKFLAFLAKIVLTFMTLTFHPKVIIGFPENLPSAADIPVSTDTLVMDEGGGCFAGLTWKILNALLSWR